MRLHRQHWVPPTPPGLPTAGCGELGAGGGLLPIGEGKTGSVTTTPVYASTLGRICSFYYLKHATVGIMAGRMEEDHAVLTGPLHTAMPALTKLLCDAAEFDEVPVRHNEETLNAQLAEVVPWKAATAAMSDSMDDAHVKAFLLLQAHMARLPLPIADYVNDTKSVLDQAARVINAMIDIAADGGHLTIALRLMTLMQAVTQACMPGTPSLAQLRHMTPRVMSALQARFAPASTPLALAGDLAAGAAPPAALPASLRTLSLGELASQKLAHVESALKQCRGLSHRSVHEVVGSLASIPILDTAFSAAAGGHTREQRMGGSTVWKVPQAVSEDDDGDMVLTVRLRVSNPRRASSSVRGLRNSKPKSFGWWLAVGAGTSAEGGEEELLALKRVRAPMNGKWAVHTLSLPLPLVRGRCSLDLFVVCDAIAGTDQQYAVPLLVEEPRPDARVEALPPPADSDDSDGSDEEEAAVYWAGAASMAAALTAAPLAQ